MRFHGGKWPAEQGDDADMTGSPALTSTFDQPSVAAAAPYLAQVAAYSRIRDGAGVAILALLVVAGLVLPSVGVSSYTLTLIYFGAFYAGVGQSWNLITGFTGYLSIAHGAFVGIGAYTTIVMINQGMSAPVSVLIGMGVAGAVAVLLAWPAVNLSKLAFAFATLFFTEVVRRIVLLLPDLTGGPSGLYSARLFSLEATFRLMVVTSALFALGVLLLRRSLLGREMFAVREDELAATTLGIPSRRIVLGGFAASAMAASLFGGIHGLFLGSVLPDHFLVLRFSLVTLAIPLIGGLGTVSGPLAAGFIYAWLREQFQVTAPEFHMVLLGVAITLVATFAPNGLVPKLSRRWQPTLIAWLAGRGPQSGTTGGGR